MFPIIPVLEEFKFAAPPKENVEFAFFVSAGFDAPPPNAKGELVAAGAAAGVGALDPPPKLKGDDVLPAGACVAAAPPPNTGALVFEPNPPPPNVVTFDFGAPNAGGAEF